MSPVAALGLLVLSASSSAATTCSSGADANNPQCSARQQENPSADNVAMVQMGLNVGSGMDNAAPGARASVTGSSWTRSGLAALAHGEGGSLEDGALVLPDEPMPNELPLLGTYRLDDMAEGQRQFTASGDFDAFLATLKLSSKIVIVCILLFITGQCCLPHMFAFRVIESHCKGEAKANALSAPLPWKPSRNVFGKWVHYSFAYTRKELIEACGLDAAMLIAFTEMSLEILAAIGIPFLVLACPVYYYLGGMAAGGDALSCISIANLVHKSGIYWPVAVATWFVVIFTQFRLFHWMRMFIQYRKEWLMGMPTPQSSTILVEGIPDHLCSDASLRRYFHQMFGESSIKEVFVVRKSSNLEALVEKYRKSQRSLKQVLFKMKSPGSDAGLQQQQIYHQMEIERLTLAVRSEQERIVSESKKDASATDIYAASGFVTFTDRGLCEQALFTQLHSSNGTLVLSRPPAPADVIYTDLQQGVVDRTLWSLLGYVTIGGLFLALVPVVVAISQVKPVVSRVGFFRQPFASTLASLALTILMSMLPTILMWIFNFFFALKAKRWAQLHLQAYYFPLLILSVLLVTSLGISLTDSDSLGQILQRPFLLISVLADGTPSTIHFYMSYVVMQWVTHGLSLTRFMNVLKYLIFKRCMESEDARAMSEPEDQDYDGIGSRSARFSLMFVIGLVFCGICPMLVPLVWINFFICRLFYGYLIPYAEQRKVDLGGDHFALQLTHAHLGLLLYIIVMTGLLAHRAANYGPAGISAASFVWWAISFYKFRSNFRWESLSYEEVLSSANSKKRESSAKHYRQTILDEKVLDNITSDPLEE